MKKDLKKTILKVGVSVALLGVIFWKIDKKSFVEHIRNLNPYYVLIVALFIILNYVVSSIRWKKLLTIYSGSDHVSLFTLIKLYFIGAFFNNFLPTSVGGDVYKAYRLGKLLNEHSKAFASTFMERFSGVVVLALFSSLGLISTFKWLGVGAFALFWVGIFVGYKMLGMLGKRFPKLGKFTEALDAYKSRKDIVFYALFTSIFVQLFSVLTQYFIFAAMGINIPLGFSFFAFPVITLASFIIPSQNSFGVQDYLYIAFFSQVAVSVEAAVSASIVYHLMRLMISLIGGLFYAVEK